MQRLRIRDARDDERGVIRAVTLAAYAEYAASMGDHWDDYRRGLLARLDGAVADRIVAERDGEVVGSVLLYPAGTSAPRPDGKLLHFDSPEVGLLSVKPAARGQGIGAALIAECARRARQAGASALTLHTMDMMHGAARLYERMGFVRDHERDFRPAERVTVRAFRLDLNGR